MPGGGPNKKLYKAKVQKVAKQQFKPLRIRNTNTGK